MSGIGMEHHWRCPCEDTADIDPPGTILVSRWTRHDTQPIEVDNPGSATHHCIAINLKCTSLRFTHAGRTLVRGRVTAGAIQVTAPQVPCSATFEAPGDVLHVFVSQQVLSECFEDAFGRPHAGEIRIDAPGIVRDPALERLAQALAVSQSDDTAPGKAFTDGVSLAIVSRVIARHFTFPHGGAARRVHCRRGALAAHWNLSTRTSPTRSGLPILPTARGLLACTSRRSSVARQACVRTNTCCAVGSSMHSNSCANRNITCSTSH